MDIDFDKYMLSALEIDEINKNCAPLTAEEQEIHEKYTGDCK